MTKNTAIEGAPNKEIKNDIIESDAETLKAQAGLRGSVGGVNGILGIQSSVTAGTTDRESAVTILMEIYGFTRTISEALLGVPLLSKDLIDKIETTQL